MKIAFLYAGQGSQKAMMGKDFYDTYPEFREAFDAGDLDFDLHEVVFNEDESKLNETKYTQPAMVAFACGVTAVLKAKGIVPEYAAGLSLGEYSALHAAGVFDAKTAIELVAYRGKVMTEAAAGIDCGMTAVLNLGEDELKKCCEKASEKGVVSICNYNCPGQLVIGGEKAAVDYASELAKEAGAKRCMPLKVSGPFHTGLMKPAGDALREKFKTVDFSAMNIPVIFNCIGREKDESETIEALLEKQVQSSVYMEQSIRRLSELSVDTVIEIGPGRALSGFVKKTVDGINCISVEKVSDIESLEEKLGGLNG